MNSSTSRNTDRKQSQEEIKRQIALLQARLVPEPEPSISLPKSPKRKAPVPVTLAPATPSPKKKRKLDHQSSSKPLQRPVFQLGSSKRDAGKHLSGQGKPLPERFAKPAPSKLLNNLANLNRKAQHVEAADAVQRSTGFAEKPLDIQPPMDDTEFEIKRDDRLALVESLEPGPYEHNPPLDDPEFDKLEPHSGIALLSRNIPHEEFADHLRGRYYLSPSRLYSAIRPLPDKQGYDVPVPGDWITIAVIAERGPIKFSRAPVAIEREDGDPDPKKKKTWKGKGKDQNNGAERPSSGKKYVNLKLIDFGARSGSSTGGKSVIRGDAFLTLLLFEADTFDFVDREDGRKPEKVYRGGSRGAFEHLTEVKEGDAIALLNPKILKPFQRSNDTPHPVDNVLALTPECAASIMVIGRARDLGMCTVRKQDGKVCGSWCDKRVSEVCDYHVQNAVQRRRAARPEFAIGTSGLSTSSTHKRKNDYDPARQWGLKPEENNNNTGSGSTYVVSGHVVSGTSSDPRTMYAVETIGREGQAKAKRKLNAKDADRALKALLERDKEGMKVVMKAREAVGMEKKGKEEKKAKGKAKEKVKTKRKRARESDDDEDDGCSSKEEEDASKQLPKTTYSAGVIKSLGFDPTLKPGQKRLENQKAHGKLEALEAVRMARKEVELGPRPGPRIRSGVVAPKPSSISHAPATFAERDEVTLDSDDEDLPESVLVRREGKMVDLDDF